MASDQGSSSSAAIQWSVRDYLKGQVDDCAGRTNWEAIRERASSANNGQPCKFIAKETSGANFMARPIEFQDGTCWVALVQMQRATPMLSRQMQIRLDTQILVKTQTKAPVPQVFAYELDDKNPAGVAYSLQELIPGNIGDSLRDRVPDPFRQEFHRTMAAAHVQIASVRFPQIGAVTRAADGSFSVGPIPFIGGPFDTAAEFMHAFAEFIYSQMPEVSEHNRKLLPPAHADDILGGLEDFPQRLADMAADGLYFTREGPFPLRHPELLHNNILYDREHRVLGVIDFAHAMTVPWELVDLPRCMTGHAYYNRFPEDYDEAGRPKDKADAAQLDDAREYAAVVREAEEAAGTDHKLSDMLLDQEAQDFACTIHGYSHQSMGFYNKAMDYYTKLFESRQQEA